MSVSLSGAAPTVARRSLLLAAGTLLAACTPSAPKVEVRTPSSAPATDRVTRILLWLPPNSGTIDSPRLAAALSAKFIALGVDVEAVVAQPLELDRADAQRPVIARFRPTHRLSIEQQSATSQGGAMAVGIVVALYAMGPRPVRIVTVVSSGRLAGTTDSANQIADDIVAKLQASGVAIGR